MTTLLTLAVSIPAPLPLRCFGFRLSFRQSRQIIPPPAGAEIVRSTKSGFRDALSSSYLLNVSLFLLLYAVTSTFVYFQQAAIVSHSFADRGAQTAFFASIEEVTARAIVHQALDGLSSMRKRKWSAPCAGDICAGCGKRTRIFPPPSRP